MFRRVLTWAGILLPIATLLWGPPPGLSVEGNKALALALFVIPFFVAETLPFSVTGLILLFLFILLRVVPPRVALSGFTAPAFWLIFSSFLLGGGMLRTGLARRMALGLIRLVGERFNQVLMGFCILGFLLPFGIPSGNARVALLVPISLEIGFAFGLKLQSRGFAALVLATTMSAFYPGFALITSNVPNLIHVGVIESVSSLHISYGQWAYLHLPVLGVFRVLMVYAVVRLFLWPKDVPVLQGDFVNDQPKTRLTPDEWKMVFFLSLAVGLWVTDFLHGLKPAWVGLGVALTAMLPGVGVLKEQDIRSINLSMLVYIASIFGLGTALSTTGVSEWAGKYIFRVIPLAEMGSSAQVAVLALITLSLAVLTTHPAVPAFLTPIVIAYGMDKGLDVNLLVMAQVLGIGISFFPYQTPPMVTAQGFGAFTGQQALRVLIPFGILSVVLVIPLTIFYWKLIGFLP
jgi:anion transporter